MFNGSSISETLVIYKLKHKYGAIKTKREGISFPSKLEGDCFTYLENLKRKNEILFFLRQVAFDLPGPAKHYVDFMVFFPYDAILIEAKGRDLSLGRMKRLQVEELYGVKINVIKSTLELCALINECQE